MKLVRLLCCSSAYAACSMPTKSEWCLRYPGYKFPTGVKTAEDCCAACSADSNCASWTFIGKTETSVVNEPACHLKNITNFSLGEKGSICTSGATKPFPAPSPPTPRAPTPAPVPVPAPPGALNVLFLVVGEWCVDRSWQHSLFSFADDLRPEFNKAYGQQRLVTPNMDKFVSTSLTFDRAYVQYSHCSPSRNRWDSG